MFFAFSKFQSAHHLRLHLHPSFADPQKVVQTERNRAHLGSPFFDLAPANSKVPIPIQKVAQQRAHTEFWRRPEGSQKASHFILGSLFLVCAAIITWVSASKKDSKTLRFRAVSRWISFAIKVMRKPTGYRSHHWLRGPPPPSSTGHPCLGLWESKLEHVLVGFRPIEQRDVAHQNLAWERNLPYPINDCRHLLAAASCHFSRWRLALICTKPRVGLKQQ